MNEERKILITGGTSGLGLELVKIFLGRGYYVVTTGRKTISFPEYTGKYSFYHVDFSDLKMTADVFRKITGTHQFDFIINNAGILSPHKFTLTKDGNEYTFQVNFLAHLLANEIIISNQKDARPLRIVAITSPVYKLGKVETSHNKDYEALNAYSDSKLFLVLMCGHLYKKYGGKNLVCYSFNPGVFGSGIYRMRGSFFTFLYRIAAPFMRKPSRVASALFKIITEMIIESGAICNSRRRITLIADQDAVKTGLFWEECQEKIGQYLQ